MSIIFVLLVLAVLLIDVYAFRGMRRLFSHRRLTPLRVFALKTYWLVDILFILFSVGWVWYIRNSGLDDYVKYRMHYVVMAGFLMIFLPKLSFFLFTALYDVKLIMLRISQRLFTSKPGTNALLARWKRSKAVPLVGFLVAVYVFSATLYGVGFGRFNFQVETVEVWIDDLPEAFDGFRMVQFSDTHLGSFSQVDMVEAGLNLITSLDPDVIVFTGDMVNNEAGEALKFISVFRQLEAREGMFSVLGNHDMGDYRRWGTIEEKSSNIDLLVEYQREMGFDVLLNEHRFIRRGSDSIMIAGVKNWGLPPFAQYGDIDMALGEYRDFPFIIMASHDPSHWRAEVIPKTNVHLTLSGHTHGMQFGITNRFFSWSPVKLKYNEWSGLYSEGNQKLYVNRGFGYLSFPGRVGMPPEITLIVLRTRLIADGE